MHKDKVGYCAVGCVVLFAAAGCIWVMILGLLDTACNTEFLPPEPRTAPREPAVPDEPKELSKKLSVNPVGGLKMEMAQGSPGARA